MSPCFVIKEPPTPLESPHLRDPEYALAEARWMLDLIKTPTDKVSLEARQHISEKTVENFANHINAGFLEHRKSATLGGEFAITEWEGQGSLIRDALGREFIDMLGGLGSTATVFATRRSWRR